MFNKTSGRYQWMLTLKTKRRCVIGKAIYKVETVIYLFPLQPIRWPSGSVFIEVANKTVFTTSDAVWALPCTTRVTVVGRQTYWMMWGAVSTISAPTTALSLQWSVIFIKPPRTAGNQIILLENAESSSSSSSSSKHVLHRGIKFCSISFLGALFMGLTEAGTKLSEFPPY